ncbi:Type II secretion system protein F [Pseudobythopirellula maris]|uniref:Type II secretion system protein F n=1 Tax=Pseudobythopirellula maris TaxID=2527991 RepID=A0A5C5ZTP4_9BACT|nr:type II secretion system F family protein [Pseudobythopirellula maris]TWT90398.1 Type II secretion system protein F [Pseudobythopirellula maris]
MAGPAKLEDLIALNAEILALTRAGLPIAPELGRAAASLPSGGCDLGVRLAKRLETGESLSDAVAAQSEFPSYYAALVRAGEASGNLPAALQGLGEALALSLRMRRTCRLAIVYPVFIALAAWGLLLYSIEYLLPHYDWITQTSSGNRFYASRLFWGQVVLYTPLVLAAVAIVLWLLRPRDHGPQARALGVLRLMPGVARVMQTTASAMYCRLLSLMLQQRTPLPEALELAAEATGWRGYSEPSQQIAETIRSGGDMNDAAEARQRLPPLVRPAMMLHADAGLLGQAVGYAASVYEERAAIQADTTAILLPATVTAVLGGGVVAVYAVLMLSPYIRSLVEIANWF